MRVLQTGIIIAIGFVGGGFYASKLTSGILPSCFDSLHRTRVAWCVRAYICTPGGQGVPALLCLCSAHHHHYLLMLTMRPAGFRFTVNATGTHGCEYTSCYDCTMDSNCG